MLAYQRPFSFLTDNLVGGSLRKGSLRKGSGHPDAAQVGDADASVPVVADEVHPRGCEEGAGPGDSFLVEDGLSGPEALVPPSVMGLAVVPAGALGNELADGCDEREVQNYLAVIRQERGHRATADGLRGGLDGDRNLPLGGAVPFDFSPVGTADQHPKGTAPVSRREPTDHLRFAIPSRGQQRIAVHAMISTLVFQGTVLRNLRAGLTETRRWQVRRVA